MQHLVGIGALLVWGNYRAMQRVLKYVLLVFVAYVVAAFLAHPNGATSCIIRRRVIPLEFGH